LKKNENLLFLYRTPGSAKANSGLNPEADEFVPVFTVIFISIFNNLKKISSFSLLA